MATLEERLAQAQERLRMLQTESKKQKRKDELRRKILYGATLLKMLEKMEEEKRAETLRKLHAQVSRPSDRQFLGLSPETEKTSPKSQ